MWSLAGNLVRRADDIWQHYLARWALWVVYLIFALGGIWAFESGLAWRRWAWEQTEGVRYAGDVMNAIGWGNEADRVGYLHLYDQMVGRNGPEGQYGGPAIYQLDYAPTRLLIVELWAHWGRDPGHWGGDPATVKAPVSRWQRDYAFTEPMLRLNTTCEFASCVALFLLVHHWIRRGDRVPIRGRGPARQWTQRLRRLGHWLIDRPIRPETPRSREAEKPHTTAQQELRPPEEDGPWRPYRGLIGGSIAALCFWFNPAIIWNAHCWPQWDVWILPFFLWAIYFASLEWWLSAGLMIGLACLSKSQLLMVAPILVLWPLLAAKPSAVVRVVIGFALGLAIVISPWLLNFDPAAIWWAWSEKHAWPWQVYYGPGGTWSVHEGVRWWHGNYGLPFWWMVQVALAAVALLPLFVARKWNLWNVAVQITAPVAAVSFLLVGHVSGRGLYWTWWAAAAVVVTLLLAMRWRDARSGATDKRSLRSLSVSSTTGPPDTDKGPRPPLSVAPALRFNLTRRLGRSLALPGWWRRAVRITGAAMVAGFVIWLLCIHPGRHWAAVTAWFSADRLAAWWAYVTTWHRQGLLIAFFALVLVVTARLLPRRAIVSWAAFALAGGLLLCIPLFRASTAWYTVGVEYGQRHYPNLYDCRAANLGAILQQRYGWSLVTPLPRDALVAARRAQRTAGPNRRAPVVRTFEYTTVDVYTLIPWLHDRVAPHHDENGRTVYDQWRVPLRSLMITAYAVTFVLCGFGAARHGQRNDPRLLFALLAPWVLMFALLPQMFDRYLVWGVGVSAAVAGISLGGMMMHVALTAITWIMMSHFMLERAAGWAADVPLSAAGNAQRQALVSEYLPFVARMHPDLGWAVLALAGVALCLAITPTWRRVRGRAATTPRL